jgi:hypothetical protein
MNTPPKQLLKEFDPKYKNPTMRFTSKNKGGNIWVKKIIKLYLKLFTKKFGYLIFFSYIYYVND